LGLSDFGLTDFIENTGQIPEETVLFEYPDKITKSFFQMKESGTF